MQEQLPSSEGIAVMGIERRAEESKSLIQTRLAEANSILKQAIPSFYF